MEKQYQWRTTFTYQNELAPNNHLSYGVVPSTYATWQTATVGVNGSNTTTYYYHDSNTTYLGEFVDAISTRVACVVTQTWTTSVDSSNNLTVSVATVIDSIDRDNKMGADQNTPGRVINVYKEQGGTAYISVTDNQVATEHNISGSVNMGTYTFTLAPGQNATMSTLYIHNQTVGMQSYDDIRAGIEFMNTLPAEAIPHAVRGGSDEWLSHNRAGGDLRIWDGLKWTDNLKNTGWGTEYGDPPSVRKEDKWLNARVFGKES